MAAVSTQFTPRSTARWMASMERSSSCGPQPKARPPPLDLWRLCGVDGEFHEGRGVYVYRDQVVVGNVGELMDAATVDADPAPPGPHPLLAGHLDRSGARGSPAGRHEGPGGELPAVYRDRVERADVVVDRRLVPRLPAQHEELEAGRAADEVARVVALGEAGAALDELVGEPQPVDEVHEPLVGEQTHRLAAHLDHELVEAEIGGVCLHAPGLPAPFGRETPGRLRARNAGQAPDAVSLGGSSVGGTVGSTSNDTVGRTLSVPTRQRLCLLPRGLRLAPCVRCPARLPPHPSSSRTAVARS